MKFRKKTGAAILTFLLALSVGTGFVSSAENEQDAIENKSLEELDTLKVKNNVRLKRFSVVSSRQENSTSQLQRRKFQKKNTLTSLTRR